MYVLLIYLGAWTDAPVTPPFLLKHDCPFGRTPVDVRISWLIIPLRQPPPGTTRSLDFFRLLNCLVYPPYQTIIFQEMVGLKLRCTFNIGHQFSLYTTTAKHSPIRLLKFAQWLLLVRLTKVNLQSPVGVKYICREASLQVIWGSYWLIKLLGKLRHQTQIHWWTSYLQLTLVSYPVKHTSHLTPIPACLGVVRKKGYF